MDVLVFVSGLSKPVELEEVEVTEPVKETENSAPLLDDDDIKKPVSSQTKDVSQNRVKLGAKFISLFFYLVYFYFQFNKEKDGEYIMIE